MTVIERLIVRGRSVLRMNGAAEDNTNGIQDGTLRLYNDGTSAYIQVFSRATGAWHRFDDATAAAALYAPIGAAFITDGADATLTAEVNGAALVNSGNADALHTHDHGAGVTGLTDDDHTIYLLADGTRALTGNLSASAGVTVDGVDISAHDADGDAHHAESHTVVSHSDTTATGSELNTLTDGSNADSLHSHAGLTTLNVSSDVTYSADTSLATITGLSFTASANADYAIWGCLMVTESNPGGDMKLQWTAPASAVAEGVAASDINETDVFDESNAAVVALVDGTRTAVSINAVLDMAGTGGTVGLQAAQNGATGSLIIEKGSWLAYQSL